MPRQIVKKREEVRVPTGRNVIVPSSQSKDIRLQNFYQSNEPTPLIPGGIITSDLTRNVGSPVNKDGLDIFAPKGTPIQLPISGEVIFTFKDGKPRDDSNGGFGNQVIIRDEQGNEHQISHLSTVNVNEGDIVAAFQKIGVIGNTGTVLGRTGIHIDWEVKKPDGLNMDIREVKDFGEQNLPQDTLDKFELGQLDFDTHHEAMQELDPSLAKDFDRGFLKGISGEIKDQYTKAKESFEEFGEKTALQQSAAGFLAPLKMAKGIIQAVGSAGVELTKATIGKFANAPEVIRVSLALAQGREPDVGDLQRLQKHNQQSINAVNQAFGLVPTPIAQIISPAFEALQAAPEEGIGEREALGRGAVRGTQRVGLLSIFKRGSQKKVTKEVEKARKAGVSEQDITRITRETDLPPDTARSLLEQQRKFVKDPRAKRPLQAVGDDVIETLAQMKKAEKEIGAQIGQEVRGLKFRRQKINSRPFVELFTERARQLNIKISPNGKLDFSRSKVSSLSADKKLLQNLWQKVTRTDNTLADIEALQGELGNVLSRGRRTGELTQSQGIAEGIRQLSDEVVSNASPRLKELKSDFSLLRNTRNEVERIAGPEGIKSPQVLRRAFSNVSEVPTQTLQKLQDVSGRFNIQSGKNILDKAEKAVAIETTVTPRPQPTSLEGIQQRVARSATEFAAPKLGILSRLFKRPEKVQAGREQAVSGLISRVEKGPIITQPTPRIGPPAAQPAIGVGAAAAVQPKKKFSLFDLFKKRPNVSIGL